MPGFRANKNSWAVKDQRKPSFQKKAEPTGNENPTLAAKNKRAVSKGNGERGTIDITSCGYIHVQR